MASRDEKIDEIAEVLRREFRSFGGGLANPSNPVSVALADEEPQFAAGVGIRGVVVRVLELAKTRRLS